MIKVRIDKDTNVEDHAVYLLSEYHKKNRLPRVASVHRALEPEVCDDCHQTYWKKVDTWVSHYPCDGSPVKKEAGFS